MENKVTARNPITEGCIWKGMLLFALPIMLGSLLQQLYNTADAVIVGRALGKAALASVGGSSARISNLLVNAFVALSSGASVIVAQHFGARDTQRVRRSICTAMLASPTMVPMLARWRRARRASGRRQMPSSSGKTR